MQEAVGGRLVLGVGVSHRAVVEGRYGYSFDRPARHLRGYLSALMPALRGERVSYRDETLTAIGEVQVPTRGAPTVLVGALGPAMLRVAGELADGTITTWATPTAVADHTSCPRSPRRRGDVRLAWSPRCRSVSPPARTDCGLGPPRTSPRSPTSPVTAPSSTAAAGRGPPGRDRPRRRGTRRTTRSGVCSTRAPLTSWRRFSGSREEQTRTAELLDRSDWLTG